MNNKRVQLLTAFLMLVGVLFSQDPQFSQFYSNRLYFNPALAGVTDFGRLSLNYRNQWPMLGSSFTTYSLAYDQFMPNFNGGVGVHLMRDNSGGGALSTTNLDGIYSYRMKVSRNFYVNAGFQATYMRRSYDMGSLVYQDMLDSQHGIVRATQESVPSFTKAIFDVSSGVVAYNSKVYFGAAVHHIPQKGGSIQSADTEFPPRKYTVHVGGTLPVGKRTADDRRIYLQPSLIFQMQGLKKQMYYGLFANRKFVTFGAWARQNLGSNFDAVVILMGFMYDNVRFGYSYDITLTPIVTQAWGAHEISVTYKFAPLDNGKRKMRMISCPNF